ncbi:RecBCD enzyme subunit RecB [subsurface metagenome]
MKIQITEEDIRYSEKILLIDNVYFNEQRKEFIKNLDTIDLQAVPGSGKTTALLAKLLILEKHLPFKDGSGILVISHTNAAIDEVKKRIGNYCPRLFAYPNFVGTIQSFVDKFLAIPFYTNLYEKKPYRIDNDIYEEKTSNFSYINFSGFPQKDQNNAKRFLRVKNLSNTLRITFIDGKDVLTNGLFGERLNYAKPKGKTKPQNYTDWSNLEKQNIERWLYCFKNKFLRDGILCFDDAYTLGMKYLKKYPLIKHLLQSRFRYVFVDEMQDMDKHQYNILENIFYDKGDSASIFQRIGDKNQAIFSGKVKLENFWDIEGRKVLCIDGSCRFSKEIADVVKYFSLNGQSIGSNSIHKSIKPHLLIYKDNTIKDVLHKFSEIFKKYQNNDEIPNNIETVVKAVGWRGKDADKGKITIKDYFSGFNNTIQRSRVDYTSLINYLYNIEKESQTRNDLKVIRKNIINAVLKVLRHEGILNIDGRYFTERLLLKFLEEQCENSYREFKLNLYLWSKNIFIGKSKIVLEEVKKYLSRFLIVVFGLSNLSEKTQNFINSDDNSTIVSAENKTLLNTNNNIYHYNDLDVKIGTVHSVKGETHTATLYMETFYWRKYESERLKEFFKGNFISGNEKPRAKESLKVAYVGMSRPKYLLCVAVHYNHVKDYLDEIPNDKWEKIEVE